MEKVLSLISDLILLIFTFITMIFSILAIKNYSLDKDIITEYINNWNRGPILDIKSTNLPNCPVGYSDFLLGSYPGTSAGCDCQYSDKAKLTKQIFNITCTASMIASNCSMVFTTPQIKFSKWRGKKLCVLRDVSNFWKLEFTSSNSTCPTGKKQCGLLDTFGNFLCVATTDACPINSINILPNNQLPPYSNYGKITLDDNYNLFFASLPNSVKPVVVNIIPSKLVCVHPFEGKVAQNQYPLNYLKGPDSCLTSINGVSLDPRFEKFDTRMLISFYNENNITQMISKLPNYPQPSPNDVINLYNVNYFGWNRNCFSNPTSIITNNTDLIDSSLINTYYGRVYALYIFGVLNFVYAILLILVYKIIISCFSISHKAIVCIDIINFIFLLIIFSISVNVYGNTNKIVTPFRNFIDLSCGDVITNGIIKLSFGNILSAMGSLMTIIILSSIALIYLFFFYIYYIYQVREIINSKRH